MAQRRTTRLTILLMLVFMGPTALVASVLLAAVVRAGLDDFPEDLGKWIAVEPPVKGSDDWLGAHHDSHEWIVSLRDGRPRVERRKETGEPASALPFEIERGWAREGLSGARLSTRVDDGWIVAFNAGEFGAGLWWFSPDGKKRQKVAEAWVNGYVRTDAGLLVLEGLAHGNTSGGRIMRLARDPVGRWRSEDLLRFHHPAQAGVRTGDGSLLVTTDDQLLRVDPSGKRAEVLVKGAFWNGLYPNSMVTTLEGTTYIGMRHGVARIENKEGKSKVVWLLPNEAFLPGRPAEGLE